MLLFFLIQINFRENRSDNQEWTIQLVTLGTEDTGRRRTKQKNKQKTHTQHGKLGKHQMVTNQNKNVDIKSSAHDALPENQIN